MEIATIGFTRSSAEHFFERLASASVKRILDIRLYNASQLAGFAKGQDLAYFALTLLGASYEHRLDLAPSEDLLRAYRRGEIDPDAFAEAYLALIDSRDVIATLDREEFARVKTVLLCSEPTPDACHRRHLAERLALPWGATIEHL